MTFATAFYDWGALHPDAMPEHGFGSCSPNLLLVRDELFRRWPALMVGCYNHELINGTNVWSTHAWGAAIDVRYYSGKDSARTVAEQMCGFLIGWSDELHVDAVHDYVRQRIWRAGRTGSVDDACTTWWRAQRTTPGDPMGKSWASWLHIETTRDGWGDTTPLAERGVV